jgi:hypothetical protein
MKWENNDSVMNQHDEVKGLPLDDTIFVRSIVDVDNRCDGEKEEIPSKSHRLREINDFC